MFAFGGLSVFHGYGSVEDLEGPFASWIMRPVGTFATGNRTVAGLGGLFLLHAYEIDETEDWNGRGELLLRSMITSYLIFLVLSLFYCLFSSEEPNPRLQSSHRHGLEPPPRQVPVILSITV